MYKGESVAVLGRNGAGKSTLLKMISGVTFPTKGEVEVRGTVSALLELTSGFDPEFTGRENIFLKGHILGLSDEHIAAMEPEITAFAELGEYIDQPVRTYSSGMKARLGFSICVNTDPEILIVDEALAVGDKAFREKCSGKIDEIMHGDITLLFVTHSAETALTFCKRGVVMQEGRIVFDGPVEDAVAFYEKGLKPKAASAPKK